MTKPSQRIASLIETGKGLTAEWGEGSLPESALLKRASDTARWMQSSEHFLEFVGLPRFAEKFKTIYASNIRPPYKYHQLLGVLESAQDEIANGFLGRVVYLAHADLFGSVIEQAEELLKLAHLIPAAVLGRIVIETWLRDEAERNQIPDHESAKASVLNERLKTAGIFAIPRWRLIQGFLDVGNSAAHGKQEEFSSTDVTQLLMFAQANCI
jgi:hypothetical protein